MPEGVGCHLPFSAKSSLEAQMILCSGVFLKRLEPLSVTHIVTESGDVDGRYQLVPAGSRAPLYSPARLQEEFLEGLSVLAPFQVICGMWGQDP